MIKESGINITKAAFPVPFESGLEYNPPTRGVWNIVHTGMLIPESRQIFVCAQGCLRGVILTAAEMNAMDRMSWVTVSEQDLYDGTMEQDVIDGVRDIINRLDEKPKCVLIFLSCVHLFAGCDFKMIIDELSALFPQVHFIDCYMTPTMRKSISPDSLMRKQLYEPLEKCEKKPKTAAIIGCDRATDEASELVKIINSAGFELLDITKCKTYEEYLSMAESSLNITYIPTAKPSGEELEKRLGTKHLYLPLCYGYDEIEENYSRLCTQLGVKFNAMYGKTMIGGEKVILMKPLSFMNLSGGPVREMANYFKIDPESELIVIYDDIDLEPGQLRIRKQGSAGGHNGKIGRAHV